MTSLNNKKKEKPNPNIKYSDKPVSSNTIMQTGKYAGYTCREVLNRKGKDGLNYIIGLYKQKKLSASFNKQVEKLIENNFKKIFSSKTEINSNYHT